MRVQGILDARPPENTKQEAELVLAVFASDAALTEKLIFLLGDEARWDMLKAWAPRDPRLLIGLVAKHSLEGVKPEEYFQVVDMLAKSPSAIAKSAHASTHRDAHPDERIAGQPRG